MNISRILQSYKGSVSAGNTMLLLGLKLILLAFFILLTTMSKFEERRSREVMESVATKFRGQVPAVAGLPQPDAATGALQGAQSLEQKLKSLFKQTIPAVEVSEAADGRVLRMEMDARDLFERGSIALSPGRSAFLRRLAEALTEGKNQKRFFEFQFLHAYPGAAAIGKNSLAVLRGGALVRRLAGLGLPVDKMSAGLWPVPTEDPSLGKISIAIHLFQKEQKQGAVDESGDNNSGAGQ